MSNEQRKRKALLATVMLGLAAWGAILGVGAYLGLDEQTPSYDIRRLLVMVAATGGILLFWGAALALRARRQRRKSESRGPRP